MCTETFLRFVCGCTELHDITFCTWAFDERFVSAEHPRGQPATPRARYGYLFQVCRRCTEKQAVQKAAGSARPPREATAAAGSRPKAARGKGRGPAATASRQRAAKPTPTPTPTTAARPGHELRAPAGGPAGTAWAGAQPGRREAGEHSQLPAIRTTGVDRPGSIQAREIIEAIPEWGIHFDDFVNHFRDRIPATGTLRFHSLVLKNAYCDGGIVLRRPRVKGE